MAGFTVMLNSLLGLLNSRQFLWDANHTSSDPVSIHLSRIPGTEGQRSDDTMSRDLERSVCPGGILLLVVS